MGKDSPLKNRKKFVTSRTNKFFDDDSSFVGNNTTDTFYTGSSSKGKQFFYPQFNFSADKFTRKNSMNSRSNSRIRSPEEDNRIEEKITVHRIRSKSLENLKIKEVKSAQRCSTNIHVLKKI